MHPTDKIKEPQRPWLLRDQDTRWRERLPQVREPTQEALHLIEDIADPELIKRLRTALEHIDAEIAHSNDTAE